MADKAKIGRTPKRSRRAGGLAIGLALALLGGTLAWSALDLRTRIQTQIVQRDVEIIDAVALMQHLNDQAGGATIATLENPRERLQFALKVSRLRNVLGVRIYSSTGQFINAFPTNVIEAELPEADLTTLQKLEPVSYLSSQAWAQGQSQLDESNRAPASLLLVEVPLRTGDQPELTGVIQFLMDGSGIVQQYGDQDRNPAPKFSTAYQVHDLDRNLALKFSIAFLVGAAILIASLGLVLQRVQHANDKLAERTNDLLQANRELALAARTSAVGAVASHLIHGLKNPLSGLRDFVHRLNAENDNDFNNEWLAALGTTQRMEELINRVVRVLQEQQSGVDYEISVRELVTMLEPKAKVLADASKVRFETKVRFDGDLSNREADVILLILENLVQNAIEASPAGTWVRLNVTGDAGSMHFEVRDQGPGLPPGLEARLFMPCTSGKKGGGGIGLAISKQLAQSIGATLELAANSTVGATFRLIVMHPSKRLAPKAINVKTEPL